MTTTEPLPTETEAEHPALAIDGLEDVLHRPGHPPSRASRRQL